MQQKLYQLHSERLSPPPPSTISRLSDSGLSELDLIEHGQDFATLNPSQRSRFHPPQNRSQHEGSQESWRGLLQDTSQSSFGSSSSPVFHPGDEYRRRNIGRGIDYHPLVHHHQIPHSESPPLRQRHRPPLFGESMLARSLPSQYEEIPDYPPRPRPSFRKSSSQPTRPVSPAPSLRSPESPSGSPYHPLVHHHMPHPSDPLPVLRPTRHRPPLFGESILGSSLPSYYETGNLPDFPRTRPNFRKSSSQPTRSVSPALSLRSPTEPHPPALPYHSHLTWMSQSAMMKKRHLPQVPFIRRLSRDQAVIEAERTQMWRRSQFHHRTFSGDAATPQGVYSDSEITSRPYSADRLFYVHPTQRATSTAHQMRRGRSLARYSPDIEKESEREERRSAEREERRRMAREDERDRRSELDVEDEQSSSSHAMRPRRIIAETVGGDEGSETSSRISVTEASALTTQTPVRSSHSRSVLRRSSFFHRMTSCLN